MRNTDFELFFVFREGFQQQCAPGEATQRTERVPISAEPKALSPVLGISDVTSLLGTIATVPVHSQKALLYPSEHPEQDLVAVNFHHSGKPSCTHT